MLSLFRELAVGYTGPHSKVSIPDASFPLCEELVSQATSGSIENDISTFGFDFLPLSFATTFCEWACGTGLHVMCRDAATMRAARCIVEVACHAMNHQQHNRSNLDERTRNVLWWKLLGCMHKLTIFQSARTGQDFLSLLCDGGNESIREVMRLLRAGILTTDSSLPQKIAAHFSKNIRETKDILNLADFPFSEFLDFSALPQKVVIEALRLVLIAKNDRLAASLLPYVEKSVAATLLQKIAPKLFPLTFRKFLISAPLGGVCSPHIQTSLHVGLTTVQADNERSLPEAQKGGSDPLPQTMQFVYSVAENAALVTLDPLQEFATLTFRVGPARYVKFRNIRVICGESPNNPQQWLGIGTPILLWMYREDFYRQMNDHNNPDRFGPFEAVVQAAKFFESFAEKSVICRAAQDVSDGGWLTTEMDADGQFRIVKRRSLKSGAFKKVYEEVILNNSPTKIARAKPNKRLWSTNPKLKCFSISTCNNEVLISQILIGKGVPHILPITRCPSQDVNSLRLDMPFATGGSLYELAKRTPCSPECRAKRLKYMAQMADAVAGMHREDFIHNDLKLNNFLLDEETDSALLADFGMTEVVGMGGAPGTFPAPEFRASKEGDCWAFGLALYRMLSASQNFDLVSNAHYDAGPEKIQQARQRILSTLHKDDPVDVLVEELLSLDPRKRPPMMEVTQRLWRLLL